jgi:DNA-directed RNA polymerase subunit RPC12/RpoP
MVYSFLCLAVKMQWLCKFSTVFINIFVIRCKDCGRSFSSKQAMENHAVLHSDARPYSCSDCGKTFRQIGSLYSHRHVHQADQNGFSCSDCGRLCVTLSVLSMC